MMQDTQTELKKPNWWTQRTKLEKNLILIITFSIMAIIGLILGIITLVLSNHGQKRLGDFLPNLGPFFSTELTPSKVYFDQTVRTDDKHESAICLTPECVHTASSILNRLKPTVDPCDDFYQFACGKLLETLVLPENEVSITGVKTMMDNLQVQLRGIVSEKRAPTEPKHIRQPNKLYEACMNTTQIESLGVEPLRRITESLGGWPVIAGGDWNKENNWTLQGTMKGIHRHGFRIDHFIKFSLGVDLKNTSKRIINLDQPSLGLDRQHLLNGLNESTVVAYRDYMVNQAVLFGAKRERAVIEMRDVLQFEMDLANISWSAEQHPHPYNLHNLFTISQMQKRYPYIQWLDYINLLLPTGSKVDERELINIAVPSFFEDLGPLLKVPSQRVIANYLIWGIHAAAVPFLTATFRREQSDYTKALSKRREREDRWKECVDFMSSSLPLAVGSLYVRKYFSKESRTMVVEMVDNIRAAFSSILDEVQWMDARTKRKAQEKLHDMRAYIGYSDEILDNKKLAEYYAELEIDEQQYFQSFLNLTRFNVGQEFRNLRAPKSVDDWSQHIPPATIKAGFEAKDNSLGFPAAVLQNHFFSADRPKYINYGAIGFIIGHEIAHGFDELGEQYDLKGNLMHWWKPATQNAYHEKVRCFIEQYSNYTDRQTGLKLNGTKTLNENLADNGGIKQSYRAYKKWAAQHGPEQKLPGLAYTPEQLFWISNGQMWCSKYQSENLRNFIAMSTEIPHPFRLLGAYSNTPEFSADFYCPLGAPMNPKRKCQVW